MLPGKGLAEKGVEEEDGAGLGRRAACESENKEGGGKMVSEKGGERR